MTRKALQSHLKIMHPERKFICQICFKPFKRNSGLKQHVLSVHEKTPHICTYCGCIFTHPSSLERHVNYTHTKEKTFPCSICDKICYGVSHRSNHYRLVHPELLYSCRCGKKFKHEYILKEHEKKTCVLLSMSVHIRHKRWSR